MNAIQVLDSADIGVNHWGIEGMNYAAIGTYGGTIVRGNSINVGQFTVGGWSQLAPASGLYVGGDTWLNGNVGIGTTTPAAKLDVAGTIDCQELNFRAVGRLWSGAEMTLQSQAGKELYLNPFTGGDVVVGSFAGDRTLRVVGKVVTKTLELSSDKNAKAGFQAVNNRAVLDQLAHLAISTWHYTNAPTVRHLGPTAQDFMSSLQHG